MIARRSKGQRSAASLLFMSKYPRIKAEVTFLPESEGGRTVPPRCPSVQENVSYQPHIVIGDPNQRQAVIRGNEIQETYLGVVLLSGPDRLEFGEQYLVDLGLMYYPQVAYESVVPGATFTIREGPHIVGFGQVKDLL